MHRDIARLHIGASGQLASPKAGPFNPIDAPAQEQPPKAPLDPRGRPISKKPEIDPDGLKKPTPRMGRSLFDVTCIVDFEVTL